MKLLIILSILCLSGCSTLKGLIGTASEANDSALVSAEFTICRAASIGSIIRRYDSVEKAKTWKDFCTQNNSLTPVILTN